MMQSTLRYIRLFIGTPAAHLGIFVGTRLLALPSLVLCVTCLCSCATGLGGSRQSGEALIMPFMFESGEPVWGIAHNAEDEVQRIAEFVRPGQTVEDWTELVTSQTFNKGFDLGSVEDQIAAHQEDLGARCPGSTLEVIRQTPDGVLYEYRVVNCEQGTDEYGLARVLDGVSNRFLVQYSVRGAVTMTPRVSTAARRLKSGASPRTSSSDATSTM